MQLRSLRLAAMAFVVALLVAIPANASGNGARVSSSEAEGGNLWFVELNTTPATFRANARAANVNFQQRFEFNRLWKGVSVRVNPNDVPELRLVDGVKAVYPVAKMEHMPTAAASPELATALNMTGANTVQSEMGYTGEGVKVAIMDTGVDFDHPDLGGTGIPGGTPFPTARVVAGKDFVGDAFTGENQPNPGPTPDDCNGHGTHVAGIVGAKGQTTGVAPDVTFGAYKVFGCEGFTQADIMVAAMEQAEADGMDVLNMSIGSAFMTWPQYPTAVAASELADRGMIVVASIGNSGANGTYSAGAPGVGDKVIGVASFDNSHISALTFRTNPADTQMPYLQLADSAEAPTSGTTAEVVYVGRGCPVDPGFTPPDFEPDPYLADPAGKVALVDRGLCSFNGKYQRAVDAGAVGVVVANNTAGLFSGGAIVDRGYFAVGISLADGNALKSQINSGPVTLTWTSDRVNATNPAGGAPSSFTSYGLTAELNLKPNIGAPGGLIRAPYPLEKQGGYAILSGTSMSSPHVAGTAALLLQARPGLSWQQVQTTLQNTAQPVPFTGGGAFPAPVHRQGAGMVRIDRAILSTASVSPSELALSYMRQVTPDVNERTLTIRNSGSEAVTYTPSFAGAVGTNPNTNAPGLALNYPDVSFSAPSVTVPAGGSATIDVTFDMSWAGGAAEHHQYGGHVVLTPQGGGQALRVPVAGLQGNYLGIQVLVPTAQEFPWLTKLQDGFFHKQAEGAVYTMAGGDIPHVVAHFRHQSRQLQLVLLDAATNQPVTQRGRTQFRSTLITEDYLRRNSTAETIFAYTWDGRIDTVLPNGKAARQAAPDGNYKLQLRVLKALGDASNAAHWETWTSPAFTIAR
jgi:minor extracellular serine protease Vpr